LFPSVCGRKKTWFATPKIRRDDKVNQQEFTEKKEKKLGGKVCAKKKERNQMGEGLFSK